MAWKSNQFVAKGLSPWQRGLLSVIFTTAVFANSEPTLELDTGGHRAIVRSILWSPDDKYLVTGADDKTIRIYVAENGELLRTFRGYTSHGDIGKIYAMDFSPNGKFLAVAGWMGPNKIRGESNHAGDIRILDFATGEVLSLSTGHGGSVEAIKFSPDGNLLVSGDENGRMIIWQLNAENKYAEKRNWQAHDSVIRGLSFAPNSQLLASASLDASIAMWDLSSEKSTPLLRKITYAHSGKEIFAVLFSENGEKIFSAGVDGTVKIFSLQQFQTKENQQPDMFAGDFLFIAPNFDTTTIAYAQKNNIFAGGKSYENITKENKTQTIRPIFHLDSVTGKIKGKYMGHDDSVQCIAVSKSGIIASSGSHDAEVLIWDPKTYKTMRRLHGAGRAPLASGISEDGHSIFWGNMNGQRGNNNKPLRGKFSLAGLSIDVLSGHDRVIRAIEKVNEKEIKFEHFSYIRNRGLNSILINNHEIRTENDHDAINAYTFIPSGNLAIVGTSFRLFAVDANRGTHLGVFLSHEGPVWAVSPSASGKRLLSGSGDQTMKLWDIESRALIATIFVARDDEWIVALPSGYYAASPNGHQYFGWKINRREDQSALFYSFDQFDLIYNRPDKVYKALFPEANAKSADPFLRGMGEKIDQLKAHWQKRVATHGFKPEELEGGVKISAPEVKFAQRPADYDVVTTGDYTLNATITDPIPGQQIVGYRIYVNGVPVGKALHERDNLGNKVQGNSFSLTETVRLSSTGGGRNVIEVSGLNNKGVESRREAIRLLYKPAKKRNPHLYVAAFGVDDYKENRSFRSLEFAKKDAQEIREIFKRQGKGQYEKIHVLEKGVEDRSVTRESINALREFWKDSTVDDTVIVYFSGHGMSAPIKRQLMGRNYDDYEFYFVTSTAEILRSEKDGVKSKTMSAEAITIDQIRDLMETTPARQKILMLDTCQSFVDDKSGGKGAGQKTTVVKLKNGGMLTMRGENSNDEAAEKRLQQEAEFRRFFPELRRGVGTIEISAATNGQVAQEGISIPGIGTLENGVFTYAIKAAIEKNAAAKDGKITAKSLRAYVLNQVEELTRRAEGGATVQIPMVARDLAGRDFTLLGKLE